MKNARVRLEARDGAGNSATHTLTVALDNIPPKIHSVQTGDLDRIYKNGDTVTILVQTDSAGDIASADFSFLDSTYRPEDESVTDRVDGTYHISYTISSNNTKALGQTHRALPLRITVSDAVHTTHFDKFTVDLDNQPPIIEITNPAEIGQDTQKPFSTASAEMTILGKTEPKGSITVVPPPVTSDYNSDTGIFSFKFTLNPGENLVEVEAMDIAGNKAVKTLNIRYSPMASIMVQSAAGGTVTLPEEIDDSIPNNNTQVVISSRALSGDTEVTIRRVTDGLSAADDPDIPPDMVTPHIAYRIALKDVGGKEISALLKRPATLVLQFPTAGAEDTSLTAPQQTRSRGELLNIFKWDGVRWNNLGGTVQSNNTVSIQTTDVAGLFAVFPVSAAPQASR